MKRTGQLVALLLLVASAAFPNELWQRAVDLHRRDGDLLPGTMLVEFIQYNGAGNLISNEQSLLRFELNGDGEPESELVWARKDGEDVTEERRENPQSGGFFGGGQGGGDDDGNNAFAGLQKSPFDWAEQERVEFTDTGRTERVGGVRARRFEFVHETGADADTVGTAWLEVGSGMPVKLELTLERMPLFIESFLMTQYFGLDDENRWVSTSMEFNGAGSVLFFRREIESTMEFSDYFRAP